MPNIDLGEALNLAEADEIWAARAKAIQSYAMLEQSLASLLAALGDIRPEIGATIFFKIASADSRNKILEALFRKKFADRFNLFRNSFFENLRPLDQRRNEIVHWNAVCKAGHDGKQTTAVVVLTPANILGGARPPEEKTIDQLKEFDIKANFYSRLLNMFITVTLQPTEIPDPDRQTWLAIFSQPIIYPPPEDHPLFPIADEPTNHIQAFLV